MGMSSPKTKAEARKKIAKLQGDIAREQANLARIRTDKNSNKAYSLSLSRNRIASLKGEIADLRAQIPSLPND